MAHGVIEPIYMFAQLVDEWVVRPLELAAGPGLGDGRRFGIDRHAAHRARRQLRILRVPRYRRHLLIMRLTLTFGYRVIALAPDLPPAEALTPRGWAMTCAHLSQPRGDHRRLGDQSGRGRIRQVRSPPLETITFLDRRGVV
jgi:hypothetical protein